MELGIASDCRSVKNFKTERTNDSDKLIIYDMLIPTSLFPKTSTHRRPQVTAVDVVNIYIHWLRLVGPFRSQLSLILEILAAITLAKLGLVYVAALKVKPCRSGLRIGWLTYPEYRRGGPSFFLFFFFVFANRMVLFLKVYWKAYLALFRPPDLEKKKLKHKYVSASLENYYTSGRSTKLKLCRLWSIYRRGSQQSNNFGFSTV